jgi:general secretion pathway protein D
MAPCAKAETAGGWVKQGQNAEARGDYDTAFECYKHAYEKHPKNLAYKTHYERVRFQAAAQHVDQGRKLRAMGDPAAALTQYMRALEIDPSNQAAQQEIDETRKQQLALPAPGGGSPQSEQISHQDETLREVGSLSGPVELKPISSDPITLHMVEDTKVIYQAIGKAAGLNVLFDPDFQSKRIPVDLTNVDLNDALRIVGAIAGTFWKAETPNTIFIAQNTVSKRHDLDNLAVQTFYLTNAAEQADANEITTALRNLLDPSVKVYLVPTQNAIVMRATTDQLMLAEKIINDLDRTKPEVVVDVAILEVSKEKMTQLGISLPQNFGVSLQSLSQEQQAATTNGTTTTTTNTGSSLTLNSLGNLNANNFAVTVGSATANLLLSDSDTRVLQNPRVRATDGQQATLKIGSRIPVATGSYSAGAAASTVSLGVQTQFQYLDVGVNIAMTPTVHYDREISLKMKIEVSTQSGQTTISGVTEPIISQRVIEQEVQLREGEPSILAGLLEQDNDNALSGTPGLGQIPLLKYLFSSTTKDNKQDEIVFLLIPHIVREQVISSLNTRAIDTGTNQEIELRRAPEPVEEPADDNSPGRNPDATLQPGAANGGINPPLPSPNKNMTSGAAANLAAANMDQQARGANAPGGGLNAADAANLAATQMQQQQAQDSAPPLALNVMPPVSSQAVGSTFQMAVMAANARDLFSVPMQVKFDPKVLSLVNVDAGEMLGRDGQAVALVHRDDGAGLVTITTSRPPNVLGVTGQGVLCTLTFKAATAGDTQVTLVKVGAKNSAQASLTAVGSQSMVHVK